MNPFQNLGSFIRDWRELVIDKTAHLHEIQRDPLITGGIMNWKDVVDEFYTRGEKLKSEILKEITHSKMLNQIVSSKKFIQAVGQVIDTTDEVKNSIQNQICHLFRAMDLPSRKEITTLTHKVNQLERAFAHVAAKKIPIKTLKKTKTRRKKKKSH